MYPSVIREGDIVASPTNRKWVVVGWEQGARRVELEAYDGSGETCTLAPKLLRWVSGKLSGQTIDEIRSAQAVIRVG